MFCYCVIVLLFCVIVLLCNLKTFFGGGFRVFGVLGGCGIYWGILGYIGIYWVLKKWGLILITLNKQFKF